MAVMIRAEGLAKSFGTTRALDGVDVEVEAGTVLGLLAPEGAGKTTAVRILATLLAPTSGHAQVGGFDVVRQPHQVRQLIGLAGQYAAVDEYLSGTENLYMLGRLLGLDRAPARQRAAELLDRFDLADASARTVKTWSAGMRRRLDLAASLVGRPPVLFLDEPTTGLDPRSRNGLTRLAWALGISLGIDQDLTGTPLTARIGEARLATLAIGGAILTLGLIRPWGEIWPRWIPFLAGRRVPVAVPTILGGLAALAVTVVGLSFVRLALIEAMGLAPEPAEPPTYTGWATWAPGWLWPLWGIALAIAIATIAYYHRRHHRGAVAAGPRLR
jgi:ABC-type Na+ transport system ATPase subunit NatA